MLRWLRKVFTQNLLLKFTALVCAVVLWVYVDSFVPAERSLELSLPQLGANMVTVSVREAGGAAVSRAADPQDKIRFRIIGPSRSVRLFGPNNIRYNGPAPNVVRARLVYEDGSEHVPIPVQDFAVVGAARVQIVSVEPEEIVLRPQSVHGQQTLDRGE